MTKAKNKISIDFMWDLKVTRDRVGTATVFDKTYYENDGLTDLSKNPQKFWVFIRRIVLRVTKSGKPRVEIKSDVEEISGKTNEWMIEKLDKYISGLDGEVPAGVDKKWIPEEALELQKAIKSGALKV